MNRSRCESCLHFQRVEAAQGECHRHPPVMMPIPAVHPISGEAGVTVRCVFPRVVVDWFCGEWAPSPAPSIARIK